MTRECVEKLRRCFDGLTVFKDMRKSSFCETLGLPSFLRDWMLQHFQDAEGQFDVDEMREFVRSNVPRRDDWNAIKDRIMFDFERVKMLAKLTVDINIAKGEVSFALPDFGLPASQTVIEPDIWDKVKNRMVSGREMWGKIELGYRPPDLSARPKVQGKIKLLSFEEFCSQEVDVDVYKDMRTEFTTQEWIDILLGAVDYNPDGFVIAKENDRRNRLPEVETMKLTMLTRLLPFLEKNLNLIEFAPMSTGKSYLYGQISRYGWLSTSDRMTRAKLFYDMGRRERGLIGTNDFVVLDEVQKTKFEDGIASEMQGYLEQGEFTVGNHKEKCEAGLIVCGNIPEQLMEADGYEFMFGQLPAMFHKPDCALLDRFHGLIKGWHIPEFNDDMKVNGWALNTEYFSSVMHRLRDDITYRAVVDQLVKVPDGARTRDVKKIKQIATAYLKLLFPNVSAPEDISPMEFKRYCLRPAARMREIVIRQMGMVERQFQGKDIPLLDVKPEFVR